MHITNENKDNINKNLNGSIRISSLKQMEIKQHKVINGFIISNEENNNNNNFVKVDDTSPEVIVVSYMFPTYVSWVNGLA